MGHESSATRSRVERKVLECIDATNESIRRSGAVEAKHNALVTRFDEELEAFKRRLLASLDISSHLDEQLKAHVADTETAKAEVMTRIDAALSEVVSAVDLRVKVARAQCVADDAALSSRFDAFRGMTLRQRVEWLLFGIVAGPADPEDTEALAHALSAPADPHLRGSL